ncbi:cellular calcium ion homeostasis [Sparganum proliferum]
MLGLCLKNYCQFDGKYYQQVKGTPMGSPISGLLAELVLQRLEEVVIQAISPKMWLRYVDDTFVVIKNCEVERLHQSLNGVFPAIQFTREEALGDILPFLDVSVQRLSDGNLATSVHRKDSSAEIILNYGSNHPAAHKKAASELFFTAPFGTVAAGYRNGIRRSETHTRNRGPRYRSKEITKICPASFCGALHELVVGEVKYKRYLDLILVLTEGVSDKKLKASLIKEGLAATKYAVEKYPKNANCNTWYGVFLDLEGQQEGIKKRIENACYTVASLGKIERVFARAFFSAPPTSSYEEALGYFLKAENANNVCRIAQCYAKTGQGDKAKEYAAKVLEFTGEDEETKEAKKEAQYILAH